MTLKIKFWDEIYENKKEEYTLKELTNIIRRLGKKIEESGKGKIKIKCPFCKSINCIKRGMRYNMFSDIQKYHCKDCNAKFCVNNNYRMRYPKRVIDFGKKEEGSLGQIKKKIKEKFKIDISRTAIMRWKNKGENNGKV